MPDIISIATFTFMADFGSFDVDAQLLYVLPSEPHQPGELLAQATHEADDGVTWCLERTEDGLEWYRGTGLSRHLITTPTSQQLSNDVKTRMRDVTRAMLALSGRPVMIKYRIRDARSHNYYYLADGSKHRGCQAGYGRIVTADPNGALSFDSRDEAQKELERSYSDYERSSVEVEEYTTT